LPYSLVWFESAVAHVQCFVSVLGLTPGLVVVLVVPEQLSNFEPPGVSFVCESAEGLFAEEAAALDCELFELFEPFELAWVCSAAFACACACAEAFALGPADELVVELSSAFLACPWFSAEAEAEAVTLAEVRFAWPGGVPCGLSAQASDPVSALISAATNAAPRARPFIAAVSFRSENP
jgi:hypothetical protein